MKKPKTFAKGFTLIEIIIVVAIIGIVTAFAIPSLTEVRIHNNLSASVNDFNTGLLIARSEAVKRNSRVSVCKSAAPLASTPTCSTSNSIFWNSGWLAFTDINGNGNIDAGNDTILRLGNPMKVGYFLKGSTNVSNHVTYTSTGEADSTGTFVICKGTDTNYARQVEISLSGRINIAEASTTIASCSP